MALMKQRVCTEFEIDELPNLFNVKQLLIEAIRERARTLGLSDLEKIRLVRTEEATTRAFASLEVVADNERFVQNNGEKFYGRRIKAFPRMFGTIMTIRQIEKINKGTQSERTATVEKRRKPRRNLRTKNWRLEMTFIFRPHSRSGIFGNFPHQEQPDNSEEADPFGLIPRPEGFNVTAAHLLHAQRKALCMYRQSSAYK